MSKTAELIEVWHIEPHPYDSQFDVAVERDWAKAVSIAQDAIETLADDASDEDLNGGKVIQVKMWRTKMLESEYLELIAKD